MNPKMKSAIEKITLNDATFSNEVIEPTYVNFFYGKNGAGKSTMQDVVDFDVLPMLAEYWFDDTDKLQRWENILHGVFQ